MDQYLFLGNRARYRFVVLDYHSCSISKRRLIIELDNYKSSSIANRVRLLIELDYLSSSISYRARQNSFIELGYSTDEKAWWRVQPYGVRWSVQKNLDTDGEMLHKFFRRFRDRIHREDMK